MGGRGRQAGGLALVLMGVLGVSLACGLPMWRETSFVGANIVTAQSATGQMQCKSHTKSITLTFDIQVGRALTLTSILAGLLGFIVTLGGGGVVNYGGTPSDPLEPSTTSSSRKKVCLLGGALCVLAGILCLVSVSWSAAATISIYNDQFVTAALKREVGSSIYIGWASSVLLLIGGALICFVCGEKERTPPSDYSYMPYSTYNQYSDAASRVAPLSSDVMRPNTWRMFDRRTPSMLERVAQVHERNSLNKAQSGQFNKPQGTQTGYEQGTFRRNPSNRSGTPDKGKGLFMGMNPDLMQYLPSRASEYFYNMA